MKTKLLKILCIVAVVGLLVAFIFFAFRNKYHDEDLYNKIKDKQIIKHPYKSSGSPRLNDLRSPEDVVNPQFSGETKSLTKIPPVIPMKLFQTWHSKELPPKMQETVEKIKSNNPELEYFLYDEKDCRDFIKAHFPKDVGDAYNKLIPAAYKADLWRYCVLYIHGGVYVDIKYQCVDGFKFVDIMDREHFVLDTDPGHWKTDTHGIYNALIIAKPGNQLLLKCIQNIVHNTQTNYYGFNWLYPTGPGLLGELYFGNIYNNMSMIGNFDLVHANINKTAFVIYKNQLILQEYPEYRKEQTANQKHKPYGDLWKEHAIYSF
jgi:mannosyltransferase OCH1-like enzyme